MSFEQYTIAFSCLIRHESIISGGTIYSFVVCILVTPCENPQLKRNCHARDNTEDKNTFATQAFFPLHFSSQNHQDGKLQTCRTKLYIFVLTLFLVSFSFVCRRETLEKELEEIKQHWNYVVVSHDFKSCCMRN